MTEGSEPVDDPHAHVHRTPLVAGADLDRVRRLVDRAHHGCYIANTLNAEIVLEPVIDHAPA